MAKEKIVILGAGQAGHWSAVTLRKEGYDGSIVLVGDEPYIPYERPPLSKDILAGVKPPESCYFSSTQDYADKDIELRIGVRSEAIDLEQQTVQLSDDTSLSFDKLIIATGSRVVRPPIPGEDLDNVFYLRTLDDCLALQKQLTEGQRIVLIGGGYIGLEVAATARQLNCDVTIVEMQEKLMARVVPPELSDYFASAHSEYGVKIKTETTVTAIESDGNALVVKCNDNSTVPADTVVIGVGITPNDDIAKAAGLKVDDGIRVNEYGETSHQNIYAAGDVSNHYNPLLRKQIRLESWQNAQNHAMTVAKRICGTAEKPYAEIPWFWSVQYDKILQIAGAPDAWKNIVWRGSSDDKSFVVFSLEDNNQIEAAVGINAALDIRFSRQMIADGKQVEPATLQDTNIKIRDIAKSE
ncbi:MAG: FAD-dependent oxidoreductase [Gammaproteobacteria bacterium]|nr:FAD-dependent oxidoreductase [Gammaproteobacteria bacterium]